MQQILINIISSLIITRNNQDKFIRLYFYLQVTINQYQFNTFYCFYQSLWEITELLMKLQEYTMKLLINQINYRQELINSQNRQSKRSNLLIQQKNSYFNTYIRFMIFLNRGLSILIQINFSTKEEKRFRISCKIKLISGKIFFTIIQKSKMLDERYFEIGTYLVEEEQQLEDI
ncbi:hypothetical protein pb186bvf_006437 [Paramecium bursaria]